MGAPSSPDAELERALELAFRHLARRERTVAEMRSHLLGCGLDSGAVAAALVQLADQGYLDDARFARLFAQDKRRLADWGADRIRRELVARGVGRELVQAALGEEAAGHELERATALLRRRFPAGAWDHQERERALGLLLRKGYGYELACDALAAATRS